MVERPRQKIGRNILSGYISTISTTNGSEIQLTTLGGIRGSSWASSFWLQFFRFGCTENTHKMSDITSPGLLPVWFPGRILGDG